MFCKQQCLRVTLVLITHSVLLLPKYCWAIIYRIHLTFLNFLSIGYCRCALLPQLDYKFYSVWPRSLTGVNQYNFAKVSGNMPIYTSGGSAPKHAVKILHGVQIYALYMMPFSKALK